MTTQKSNNGSTRLSWASETEGCILLTLLIYRDFRNNPLSYEKICLRILELDSHIKQVAIFDFHYQMLISKTRDDSFFALGSDRDREFLLVSSVIALETMGTLASRAGGGGVLEGIAARYEKSLLVITKKKDHIVLMSFDPDATPSFPTDELEKIIR